MKIYINSGTTALFYPFKEFLPGVVSIKVQRKAVGNNQYEVYTDLIGENNKTINLESLGNENLENLNEIAALWDEPCFEDWLNNVAAEAIEDNMNGDIVIEKI